jgi:hypothetical protein
MVAKPKPRMSGYGFVSGEIPGLSDGADFDGSSHNLLVQESLQGSINAYKKRSIRASTAAAAEAI